MLLNPLLVVNSSQRVLTSPSVALLSELYGANAESYAVHADLCDFADPTHLSLMVWQITSAAQRTLHHWLALVDRRVGGSTDVEGIMFVVL